MTYLVNVCTREVRNHEADKQKFRLVYLAKFVHGRFELQSLSAKAGTFENQTLNLVSAIEKGWWPDSAIECDNPLAESRVHQGWY